MNKKTTTRIRAAYRPACLSIKEIRDMQSREQKAAMNAIRGAQNRAAGKNFEALIETACRAYRRQGIADIDKTPEPTRQLGRMDRTGRFSACYEKRAQPDFKGTIKGGKSVVFEAKHTSTGKMSRNVVLEQQAASLDMHESLGAWCFVLIGFGLDEYYRIPWQVWKSMKSIYGRQYVKPEDIEEYRVGVVNGLPQFLETSKEEE